MTQKPNILVRLLPLVLTLVMAVWFLCQMQPPHDKGFNYSAFGNLPVVFNGRLKPMDSLARNSLLQINEKQTLDLEPWKSPMEKHLTTNAVQWLANVMMNPQVADHWPVFRVDNPDLITFLKLPGRDTAHQEDGEYYSWNQIAPSLDAFDKENERVEQIESATRNAYERDVVKVHERMELYAQLGNTVQPHDSPNWKQEMADYEAMISPGVAAVRAQQTGKKYDQDIFNAFLAELQRFDYISRLGPPLIVPPEQNPGDWKNVGTVMLEAAKGGPISPAVGQYAEMGAALQNQNTAGFNSSVADLRSSLVPSFSRALARTQAEVFFNQMQPFLNAMVIYLLAGLLAFASWFLLSSHLGEALRRSGVWLVGLAFLIHTTGLIYRTILQGRPPVTNLYSSAIFVGWGACLLGMILEMLFKNGIGAVVSAGMGFITLIIAHNLALDGDTMEMMRAVLDSNFWLGTHVVAEAVGYLSTFVAGFLGLIYILRGVFTKTLDAATAKSLSRMIYGIVCFATLFCFVGTVLGGIWADQSWGRFWGWDPKENGALIIVLWNALILHLRWGGMIRERGLANCAVFGNIVTSWSWFGVNMLGIGLHSYGFTEGAFLRLTLFVSSQIGFIAIGLLPTRMWKSFAATAQSDARAEPSPAR
ncbi:MAG TPA: cytochrome c biogenesis protein CcsA [Verrucomicrobiae bacterium]|jgi:ABC-type transport system involved in cytochrome c biogenesis permease subunit